MRGAASEVVDPPTLLATAIEHEGRFYPVVQICGVGQTETVNLPGDYATEAEAIAVADYASSEALRRLLS